MILKKRTIPILLLFLAVLACDFLFANLPQNTESDAGSNVPRRSGECTDQRFKDAELAAYQALVQAQTDDANARNDAISRVQTAYNQNIAQRNDEYQTALKTCTTADCRQAAEKKYDTEVGSQQMHQRDGIEAARVNESTAGSTAPKYI